MKAICIYCGGAFTGASRKDYLISHLEYHVRKLKEAVEELLLGREINIKEEIMNITVLLKDGKSIDVERWIGEDRVGITFMNSVSPGTNNTKYLTYRIPWTSINHIISFPEE